MDWMLALSHNGLSSEFLSGFEVKLRYLSFDKIGLSWRKGHAAIDHGFGVLSDRL